MIAQTVGVRDMTEEFNDEEYYIMCAIRDLCESMLPTVEYDPDYMNVKTFRGDTERFKHMAGINIEFHLNKDDKWEIIDEIIGMDVGLDRLVKYRNELREDIRINRET